MKLTRWNFSLAPAGGSCPIMIAGDGYNVIALDCTAPIQMGLLLSGIGGGEGSLTEVRSMADAADAPAYPFPFLLGPA
jgi:hypothetical protein